MRRKMISYSDGDDDVAARMMENPPDRMVVSRIESTRIQ
jgi:hypothetical protein